MNLTDKHRKPIPPDSIIYGNLPGQEEKHYFSIYTKGNGAEMIACTYGYVHGVKQEDLANFELIGPKKDNLHLLECD